MLNYIIPIYNLIMAEANKPNATYILYQFNEGDTFEYIKYAFEQMGYVVEKRELGCKISWGKSS